MKERSHTITLYQESPAEELANSLTHGFGAILSTAALVIMIFYASLASDATLIVSCAVYGTSLIVLYTCSTLYHGFRSERLKHFFKILDHISIYYLIAGTYTPFLLVTLSGAWGWGLFGVMWGMALLGTFFKIFFVNRFHGLSLGIYIAMGWAALIVIKPLFSALPAPGMALLVAGGLAYTLGVIFYVWERLRFSHMIWHLFVLAGSICHFFVVLLYVIPNL